MPSLPAQQQPSARGALVAGVVATIAWLAPLGAAVVWLGPDHLVTEVGALFAHLAVVTFGGAYAVLAYLKTQAVDVHGWLTHAQMIDGLGLAETTPGPLILVNLFVGYLAGWQAEGGGAGLALAAATMAMWQTFAPSYVWIFAGAPYAEKIRANRFAAAALAAITAAVLGVVGSLAWTMARHVLFAEQTAIAAPWGVALDVPVLATLDLYALALAVAAWAALMRFKVNLIVVIAACALAGVVTAL
jgi:chromate transporter